MMFEAQFEDYVLNVLGVFANKHIKIPALLILVIVCVPNEVTAKIYQFAVPSNQGIELYWWPILPVVAGWEHDEAASRADGANMLVPKGYTFSDAPAVMYGKAVYRPGISGTSTITQFMADDKAKFKSDFPGIVINALPDMHDADGKSIKCFSFSPASSGAWELVAYGEEKEFFLIFTLTAYTNADLQRANSAFHLLVTKYKE